MGPDRPRFGAADYPGLAPFIVITILALAVMTHVPWITLFLTRFV